MARPFFPLPCLMLVTDRGLCADLQRAVAQAVAGGVNLVQLREKGLPPRELWALAQELRRVTAGRALLLVNDRADVALAVGADGVHLPEEGLPVAAARRVLGPTRLVGRSVHSAEAAARAEGEGADYLVVGPVYPTRSHPGAVPGGPGLVARVRQAVRLPVLAIGGITPETVPEVVAAGASGVAVISAILGSGDPQASAAALRSALDVAWAEVTRRA
ncbi:MAG TPA: thiamine phosphate synthase [Dehalococcoidia bacterium]|nr:thiamine phosphate synthase [Dehalococcoidia bacterium]